MQIFSSQVLKVINAKIPETWFNGCNLDYHYHHHHCYSSNTIIKALPTPFNYRESRLKLKPLLEEAD